MHRSTSYSSSGRDEFMVNFSAAALKGSLESKEDLLSANYVYSAILNDDISDDISKKDMDLKPTPTGEKVIHLIPLVLFLCALILWLFSGPVYNKL
ncbi:hypothetical protein CASFOL_013107 [Castilleja foliolosa]|uniref:Uncharacterized protein n=1 Tax=Castilleja foliolosa TaxID=1961234 RepID=A0ABD3DKV7_9LAMI